MKSISLYIYVWLHARSVHLDCWLYIYICLAACALRAFGFASRSCPVPSLSGPCPVLEFIAIAACGAACGAIVLVMELASAR